MFTVSGAPQTFPTVTPSDTNLLGGIQWLRIGAAGNLAIKGPNDAAAVTFAVTAGEYVPFGSGYVMNTNTTATGIVALG